MTPRTALDAGLAATAHHLAVQNCWPAARLIRIVVPFSAEGASDIGARALYQAQGDSLKASVIVENMGAAHENVGISEVMSAPAEGYKFIYCQRKSI